MSRGAPAPVYKGVEEGERVGPYGAPWRRPTPTGSRIPPFPSWSRRGREGGVGEKERGAAPPNLFQFGLLPKGGAPAPCGLVFFHLMSHKAHNFSRGVPVTSRYSGKMPEPLGTIPMSKCDLPIYECFPLVHFDTPRHVHDLIRDSELPSVHQNT